MKDTIWIKKGRFTPLAVVLMFAFPLVTALICLCFGRMNVPVGEVLTALRTALTGESTSNVQNYSIVINLRLPRILMAIIVGAGLSCAGNAYQSLFSNPLATPDILGVTSGTCGCNSCYYPVLQYSGNAAHRLGLWPDFRLFYSENRRQE